MVACKCRHGSRMSALRRSPIARAIVNYDIIYLTPDRGGRVSAPVRTYPRAWLFALYAARGGTHGVLFRLAIARYHQA